MEVWGGFSLRTLFSPGELPRGDACSYMRSTLDTHSVLNYMYLVRYIFYIATLISYIQYYVCMKYK